MYMPSGSFLVAFIDLMTFDIVLSVICWPLLFAQASLQPLEAACSSLNVCYFVGICVVGPLFLLCDLCKFMIYSAY